MAIQSFFKQRKPRGFEHKPIYWDARKEELNRRVKRIRNELIESGELEGELVDAVHNEDLSLDDAEMRRRKIASAFRSEAEHLQRQQTRGITSRNRIERMIQLVLTLLALGAIAWLLYTDSLFL